MSEAVASMVWFEDAMVSGSDKVLYNNGKYCLHLFCISQVLSGNSSLAAENRSLALCNSKRTFEAGPPNLLNHKASLKSTGG